MAQTLEQLEIWLEEAEQARHNLLTGKKNVEIEYHGRKVRYRDFQTDGDKLDLYIRQLREDIRVAGGGGRRRRATPVRF